MLAAIIAFLAIISLPAWFALGAYLTIRYQIILPLRRAQTTPKDS